MELAYKYPKTKHFPWSLGISRGDKILHSTSQFVGREVVVTEKLDGENTTMYRDNIHARSIDTNYHPSRTFVRQLHGLIAHEIPDGWRICGENMYGKHSIYYTRLTSYFYVFGIWNHLSCLSWDDTVDYAEMLSLKTVPVLYRGIYDEDLIKRCFSNVSVFDGRQPPVDYPDTGPWSRNIGLSFPTAQEGYVMRITDSFSVSLDRYNRLDAEDFSNYCAKWVRKDHVQTDDSWLNKPVIPNILA